MDRSIANGGVCAKMLRVALALMLVSGVCLPTAQGWAQSVSTQAQGAEWEIGGEDASLGDSPSEDAEGDLDAEGVAAGQVQDGESDSASDGIGTELSDDVGDVSDPEGSSLTDAEDDACSDLADAVCEVSEGAIQSASEKTAQLDGVSESATGTWLDDADTAWYGDGSGSVFTLTTAAQLAGLAKLVDEGDTLDGKTITLGCDIDLAGKVWNPIGDNANCKFSGTFDGAGYEVSGITTDATQVHQGLFALIQGATIENLTVSGAVVGGNNTGSIVGRVAGSSSDLSIIENCVNKASVTGSGQFTGGIVGKGGYVTIRYCTNLGSVSGYQFTGGIVGANCDGTPRNALDALVVQGCCNRADVAGSSTYVGGIIGNLNGSTTIKSCSISSNYSTGAVSESNYVGLVAGYWNTNLKAYGSNNYAVSSDSAAKAVGSGATDVAACVDPDYAKTAAFVNDLNAAEAGVEWVSDAASANDGYPVPETQAASNALTRNCVSVSPEDVVWDEDPVSLTVTVTKDGTMLAEGADYTVALLNPEGSEVDAITSGGTYTVRVAGIGSYIGVVEVPVPVRTNDIEAGDVSLSAESATYTGSSVLPMVAVIKDGVTLAEGTDYTVAFSRDGQSVSDIIDAGTYTVTVTGIGAYEKSAEASFEVTPLALKATGTGEGLVFVPSQVRWTGAAVSPDIMATLSSGSVVLEEGVDYTVVISNDEGEVSRTDSDTGARASVIDSDQYTLAVTGIGNYSGTVSLAFGLLDPDADVWNGFIETSWYNEAFDTFTLTKPAQLAGLAAMVNGSADVDGDGKVDAAKTFSGKTIKLGGDIDLGGLAWTPIARSTSYAFSGTFDGCGYAVENMVVKNNDIAGLFGRTASATVKNLSVSGTVASTGSYKGSGAVIGQMDGGVVEGVSSSATVSGTYYVGGAVGYVNGTASGISTIQNCLFSGEVTGSGSCAGGIAGGGQYGVYSNCVNKGSVASSYRSASATFAYGVGGVVGRLDRGSMDSCANEGDVRSAGKIAAGGVIGSLGYSTFAASATNVLNAGTVSVATASAPVGGVAGYLQKAGSLDSSVSTGSVTSANGVYAGEVIGQLNGITVAEGSDAVIGNYYLSDSATYKAIGASAVDGGFDVTGAAEGKSSADLNSQTTVDALNGSEDGPWSIVDGALHHSAQDVAPAKPEGPVLVTGIAVAGKDDATSITVQHGTLQMVAQIEPDDATDKEVFWSIENGSECATIDASSGLLTAVADGEVTVRATARDGSDIYGECRISISGQYVPVTSISVSVEGGGSPAITEKGQTVTLVADVDPDNASNQTVAWSIVSGDDIADIAVDEADDNKVAISATDGGTVVVRAAATDDSGVYVDTTVDVSGKVSYPTVWQGSASIGNGSRESAYAGTGSASDPYRFLVWPTVSAANASNPYTQPAQFWGADHNPGTLLVDFSVAFEQRSDGSGDADPRDAELLSSMSFDTRDHVDGWTTLGGSYRARISPVSAFDTSTGDLRIAFVWKGSFAYYFKDWTYTLNAVDLTKDLATEKRVQPGDTVRLTYYGGFSGNQNSGGTNYSVDFDTSDTAAACSVVATVDENGYAVFEGDQMIRYGGNYELSIVEDSSDVAVEDISVAGEGGACAITAKGGTLQMMATVVPADATNQTVVWSIESGSGCATIDASGGLLTAVADGEVTVRATACDGSDAYGECRITISGQSGVDRKLYEGNSPMSSPDETGEGSGTAEDPYVFAVAPSGDGESANPFTQPSKFWGEQQGSSAPIAQFAVTFNQYQGYGSDGKIESSMMFDTITKKNSEWADFTDSAPRLSPVTAYDTSTGELRVAFAWKGDFSRYFSDWTYCVDAQTLTQGLSEDKRVKPGDTVVLTYYGNYDSRQTNRGTDYSIDFSSADSAVTYSVGAVVNENGYAVFEGNQMIRYGGNYVLSISETGELPVNPDPDPDGDDVIDDDVAAGLDKTGGPVVSSEDEDASPTPAIKDIRSDVDSASSMQTDIVESLASDAAASEESIDATSGGSGADAGFPFGLAFAAAAVAALIVAAAWCYASRGRRKGGDA